MKNLALVDMYNMAGRCPAAVLQACTPFALRNLADASDTQVVDMQDKLIRYLSVELFGLEPATRGFVLHSGSEANETAILIAKRATNKKIVIASTLCHSSIDNSCKKLGMELIKVGFDTSDFRVTANSLISEIEKYRNEVAALVLTAGTTKLGTSDDLRFNSQLMRLIKSQGIRLHMDAAYGGFILGLDRKKSAPWTGYQNIDSITVDTHKFVGALGCGVLLLPSSTDKLLVGPESTYFDGNASALGTTRSAFALATALKTIQQLGSDGLETLAIKCRQKALSVSNLIERSGLTLITPAETGVIPISLSNAYEVEQYKSLLKKHGFKVSVIEIAVNNHKTIYGIRIVITPKKELTKATLNRFLRALDQTARQVGLN